MGDVNLSISEDRSSFDMSLTLNQTLTQLVWIFILNLTTKRGIKHPNFMYHSVDFCKFLVNPTTDFALKLVHSELSKSGQWMKKCPIQKVNLCFFEYYSM